MENIHDSLRSLSRSQHRPLPTKGALKKPTSNTRRQSSDSRKIYTVNLEPNIRLTLDSHLTSAELVKTRLEAEIEWLESLLEQKKVNPAFITLYTREQRKVIKTFKARVKGLANQFSSSISMGTIDNIPNKRSDITQLGGLEDAHNFRRVQSRKVLEDHLRLLEAEKGVDRALNTLKGIDRRPSLEQSKRFQQLVEGFRDALTNFENRHTEMTRRTLQETRRRRESSSHVPIIRSDTEVSPTYHKLGRDSAESLRFHNTVLGDRLLADSVIDCLVQHNFEMLIIWLRMNDKLKSRVPRLMKIRNVYSSSSAVNQLQIRVSRTNCLKLVEAHTSRNSAG